MAKSRSWKNSIKLNRKKCIEIKSIPIIQFDLKGNKIKEYSSITEAKKQTGIKGIANVLRRLAKTAGKYIWVYKKEVLIDNIA